MESLHVCRLLDFALRPGSRNEYEVGLVLEALQGDLGADLKNRSVLSKSYSESELLQILDNVSDALVFAKLQGVAHLDIKPANIFVDSGEYKLGNFGSACDAEAAVSVTGDVTLLYMSPEMRVRLLGDVQFFSSNSPLLAQIMQLLDNCKVSRFAYCGNNKPGKRTQQKLAH